MACDHVVESFTVNLQYPYGGLFVAARIFKRSRDMALPQKYLRGEQYSF